MPMCLQNGIVPIRCGQGAGACEYRIPEAKKEWFAPGEVADECSFPIMKLQELVEGRSERSIWLQQMFSGMGSLRG